GLGLIPAILDDRARRAVGAHHAVGPAHGPNRLVAFGVVDEVLDVYHGSTARAWETVRVEETGDSTKRTDYNDSEADPNHHPAIHLEPTDLSAAHALGVDNSGRWLMTDGRRPRPQFPRSVIGHRSCHRVSAHSRVHELETRERDLAGLAGEGQVGALAPLLLLHASDLVLARVVDRRLSAPRDGQSVATCEVGVTEVVLSARRVGLAQVVGPPGRGRFHRFHRLHRLHRFHGFHHGPRGYGESIRPLRPREGFFADPHEKYHSRIAAANHVAK